MRPVEGSGERVEIELKKDTSKATIYLGGKPILTVVVECRFGNWASGSEGLVAALEGLVSLIRKQAPNHGVEIRPGSFVRTQGEPS